MSREFSLPSFIVILLVMLFISGCWTLASAIPYPIGYGFRVFMISVVSISNVGFLISLLTSILNYAGVGNEVKMKRISVATFSIGITALVVSVILFSVAYIMTAPRYYPD